MNKDDLRRFEKIILEDYQTKVHKLRLLYAEENAEFEVGDFIKNVTGIIKVERISYKLFRDSIEIVYKGYRYWPHHGKLKRTKDKKISELKYELTKVKL